MLKNNGIFQRPVPIETRISLIQFDPKAEELNTARNFSTEVQNGRILPFSAASAPQSPLKPYFGVEVPAVDRLLSRQDNGDYELDIASLVREVEKTGNPAKRHTVTTLSDPR